MKNSNQENPQQPKLPKLKAFETTQKNFAMIGIRRELLTQSYPLNGKVFTVFLWPIMAVNFIYMYARNDIETFVEYTQSMFMASTAILVIFALIILMLKVKKLFEFIDRFDSMINTRK